MSNTAPEGWTSAELTKFCEVVGGGTPDRSVQEYWNGDIPWASPTEITSRFSKYISKTKECISQKGLDRSSAKLHPAGTVLMTSRASIGYVAINTIPMATNQGFQSLRCKEHALADYIYQYVIWIRPELEKMSAGSTFAEISSSSVKKLRVTLPPLPEQQKIAAILSSVDDVIEKTRAQIDKLKDLKTGMMQELLTKGVGSDGVPHTEFKDSPVGRVPANWKVIPLEELCTKVSVGIASSTTHAYASNGVPLLRNQNILPNAIRYTDVLHISREFSDENASKKIREGDVLTVRTGYPGISAVVPKAFDGCHSFTTLISRPKKSLLNPHYLSLLINSDYGKHFVVGGQAGGAQQNLNATTLKTFPVLLPPLSEQVAIYDAANSVSAKIALVEKRYRLLIDSKKALMQDLLTGKVRVKVDQKESAVA